MSGDKEENAPGARLVVITCAQGCGRVFDGKESTKDYTDHIKLLHSTAAPAAQQKASGRAPPIVRPTIHEGCTPAQWQDFVTRWGTFYRGAQVNEDLKVAQFVSCLSEELQSKLGRTDENFGAMDWNSLVQLARGLAVNPDAMGAMQQPGERIRPFYLRCKGMGLDCEFSIMVDYPELIRDPECKAAPFRPPPFRVDFSDTILAMTVLKGMYDMEIKKHILSVEGIHKKSALATVGLIEAKEQGRDGVSPAVRPAAATQSVAGATAWSQNPPSTHRPPSPPQHRQGGAPRFRPNTGPPREENLAGVDAALHSTLSPRAPVDPLTGRHTLSAAHATWETGGGAREGGSPALTQGKWLVGSILSTPGCLRGRFGLPRPIFAGAPIERRPRSRSRTAAVSGAETCLGEFRRATPTGSMRGSQGGSPGVAEGARQSPYGDLVPLNQPSWTADVTPSQCHRRGHALGGPRLRNAPGLIRQSGAAACRSLPAGPYGRSCPGSGR